MNYWVAFLSKLIGTFLVSWGGALAAGMSERTAAIAATVPVGTFLLGAVGDKPQGHLGNFGPTDWKGGRAEAAALFALATLAVAILLALATLAAANAATIMTRVVTVGPTPAIVGESRGRGVLDIQNVDGSAAIACGPSKVPAAQFFRIAAGLTKRFGIEYRGQYTAEEAIACYAPALTPVAAHVSEEGAVREYTPTITPTNTPTSTVTLTPTNTPTSTVTLTPTNTPTSTPTNTPG